MGTRLLALFGGGLGGERAPVFLEPRIIIAVEEIRLTCSLTNAFPKELRKLAQTGTPVVIYAILTVSNGRSKQQVASVTVEHRLVYDVIAQRFCVSRSAMRDTVCSGDIDSAVAIASAFRSVPVLAKKSISKEQPYVFSVQAILGKTRVEALDNREIDCMYYWNYKRPSLRTDAIVGDQLLRGAKTGVTK